MAKREITSEPKLLADALKKQISSLKRRRAFVSYYEASELAYEVEKLSQDIFSQLLPLSPDLATQLLEKLLATAPQSLERCDDSNGSVGYAYQEMAGLWLLSARRMDKPQKHWIKKIRSLVECDNYSILDLLLPNANKLLSEESLRELALCYETDFENEKDEWQADRCSINICAIAEALGDCELFERGMLLRAPRPNERVRESLVRFCLKQNDTARALKWLNKSDDSSADWLIFQIESYQKLDELKKLPVLCEKLIKIEPSLAHLKIASDACPTLNNKWKAKALKLLPKLDVSDQIELLIGLDDTEKALNVALKEYESLQGCYYKALNDLLRKVPDQCFLLRVILYRCLLLDLLARGYNKAYPYGARYLKTLRSLDKKVTDYRTLDDHERLEQFLQEKHGKKRSFWAYVE